MRFYLYTFDSLHSFIRGQRRHRFLAYRNRLPISPRMIKLIWGGGKYQIWSRADSGRCKRITLRIDGPVRSRERMCGQVLERAIKAIRGQQS